VEVIVILSNSTGAGRVVSIGSDTNKLMASNRGVVIIFI
jgi:hypothetical protein